MEQDPASYASSGEDTEDASETEMWSPFTKQQHEEQSYHERRADLLRQLELARQRKHPAYLKILHNLETELNERLQLNEIELDSALASVNRDCLREKAAAEQEFAEKRAKLIADVISELEEEKKTLRCEIDAMELNGNEKHVVKRTTKRQLRPRLCGPIAVREPGKINFLLSDEDIEHDLQVIRAGIEASERLMNGQDNGGVEVRQFKF